MLSKPSDEMPRPPKKELISSTPNTVLIIVIVILVGIIGLAAGYILFGSVNHTPITNNTTNTTLNSTNQTNTSVNNSTANNQNGNNTQPINSEEIAVNYAKQHDDPNNEPISVLKSEYIRYSQNGYAYSYVIEIGNNPNNLRQINVDTVSGEVVADFSTSN